MVWYYVNGKERIGPVDEAEFEAAVETGLIDRNTLVWNETMTQWQRYGTIAPDRVEVSPKQKEAAPKQAEVNLKKKADDQPEVELKEKMDSEESPSLHFKTSSPKMHPTQCGECGRMFERDDMVRLRGEWVCAGCKPIVVQRLKEGVSHATDMVFAGLWIRFGAKIIDGITLWVIQFIFGLLESFLFFSPGTSDIAFIFINIFNVAIGAAYTTFFLGKYGATPGKMACGLRVVTSEGEPISYARAFGRHFAEILSSLILAIGYIMAAFDDEKRTLHDRICDTRVIKK